MTPPDHMTRQQKIIWFNLTTGAPDGMFHPIDKYALTMATLMIEQESIEGSAYDPKLKAILDGLIMKLRPDIDSSHELFDGHTRH